MSADLGNLFSRLRLECKRCGWVPPEDMQMGVVQAHFDMDHDTGQVELNLVAACTCGASMAHTYSSSADGVRKDYFRCPADGSTGFLLSDEVKRRAQEGFQRPAEGGES